MPGAALQMGDPLHRAIVRGSGGFESKTMRIRLIKPNNEAIKVRASFIFIVDIPFVQ